MNINPAEQPFKLEDCLDEIESKAKYALEEVKQMMKFDSIWHPNSTKGVSLPLTDGVVRALHAIFHEVDYIRRKTGAKES